MAAWQIIDAIDGAKVPIYPVVPENGYDSVLILLPALGIRGGFYRKLANGLAEHKIATVIVEQRGNGESPYRAGRGEHFSLSDYLNSDISAVAAWCQHSLSPVFLYIGGHSLGGHMASMAAGQSPERYAGIVHLACGFPYHEDFQKPASSFVRAMIALLPALTGVLGYYPGTWFGFGGREYRHLMLDWREWARSGLYAIKGVENADQSIAAFKGRVISVAFDKDKLASDQAIERSRRALSAANVTRIKLGRAEQGDHLGHIDWGKKPDGVIQSLADWFHASPA